MADFNSIYDYYACDTINKTRIQKIDSIIDALLDASVAHAANSNVNEYSLDDGQTKIRTTYNSIESLQKAIDTFQKLRNKLINRNCIGNAVRLRDHDSFNINR